MLTAFGPLSIDMYLPALPSIQQALHTSAAAVQLTLAAFMAGMGLGQLVYGPLSDRLGRRAPLFWGVALYTVSSLACAFAQSVQTLIVLRFCEAVGAASGPVIARAVVRDLYSGREMARVLSLMMLVMGVAPILAPLAGAVLIIIGWRAIFVALAGSGVLAFVFAMRVIPERLVTGPASSIGGSVAALLADRRFVAGTLAGASSQAALFTYISGAPFVFMRLYRISAHDFALLFGLNAAGFILASQLNRALLTRFSSQRIALVSALGLCVASSLLLSVVWSGAVGMPGLVLTLSVCVASTGFILPNTSALALERHGSRAGVASSLLGATQFGASALAAALVGVLNDGTARPMAGIMAGCACLALGTSGVLQNSLRSAGVGGD
jgi:DHA1 family bicyclomycin/chloramphenicol resistance-like MFS transporter